MRRAWTLAAVAIALTGVGALVACEANGAKDPLRSAASVAVPSVAAQEAQGSMGCSNIGTWATAPGPIESEFVNPAWMNTTTGQSSSSGTLVTDVPHWPNITFMPLPPETGEPAFPNAVRMTTLRGVWQRTGGNTFVFTQIGWALDAKGDAVYVVRNSGRGILTGDCNSETIKSSLEFFLPDGTPIFTEVIPDMVAHRVTLTPPITQ